MWPQCWTAFKINSNDKKNELNHILFDAIHRYQNRERCKNVEMNRLLLINEARNYRFTLIKNLIMEND